MIFAQVAFIKWEYRAKLGMTRMLSTGARYCSLEHLLPNTSADYDNILIFH